MRAGHDSSRNHIPSHGGFTMVELLVAIAVISLLVALILPAVQSSREAMRRLDCQNRMRQVSMGVWEYHDAYSVFPGLVSFRYDVLPFIGHQTTFFAKLKVSPTGRPGDVYIPIENAVIPEIICPSDGASNSSPGGANVVACFGSGVLDHGFNGFFTEPYYSPKQWPASWVHERDLVNGSSNIVMLSEYLSSTGDMDALLRTNYVTPMQYQAGEMESLCEFCRSIPPTPTRYGYRGVHIGRGRPWYQGSFGYGSYNHALTPNLPSCLNKNHNPTGVFTASSLHPGGVNVAFADGHVEFVSNSIDAMVWRRYAVRIGDPSSLF